MKSRHDQTKLAQKFSHNVFITLLLNNFLFITASFLPTAIASAQSNPQSTISYPYKLLPDQSSEDCAINEKTHFFPYNDRNIHLLEDIVKWTRLEKKMWFEICAGNEADAIQNRQKGKISNNFLKTILSREPFLSVLPSKVIIKNAIFKDPIDLSSTTINVELHLEDSVFEKDVNFSQSKFSKSLYLNGSTFTTIRSISCYF